MSLFAAHVDRPQTREMQKEKVLCAADGTIEHKHTCYNKQTSPVITHTYTAIIGKRIGLFVALRQRWKDAKENITVHCYAGSDDSDLPKLEGLCPN